MNIKVEIKPYHFYEIQLTGRYSENGEFLWQATAPGADPLSFWNKTKKYEEDNLQLVLKNISQDLLQALNDQEEV